MSQHLPSHEVINYRSFKPTTHVPLGGCEFGNRADVTKQHVVQATTNTYGNLSSGVPQGRREGEGQRSKTELDINTRFWYTFRVRPRSVSALGEPFGLGWRTVPAPKDCDDALHGVASGPRTPRGPYQFEVSINCFEQHVNKLRPREQLAVIDVPCVCRAASCTG